MDLTRTLRGRRVQYVATDGCYLVIHADDGAELRVRWVDDNGETIKGKPVVHAHGYRMSVKLSDALLMPARR